MIRQWKAAILRCLQKDPAKRPSSVRQVAAAFPGGDPLAAALAAGETPSPEMVAASGETEGLRPAVAWAVLAGVIVSVIAAILLSAQTMLYRRVPLETPPEELAGRAREILRSVGYSEPPVDTAMGFYHGIDFLRYIAEHDKSKTRWDHLDTGAFVFWYRGSPRPLAAHFSPFFSDAPVLGSVWGMNDVLNSQGYTQAAWWNRIPASAWGLLVLTAICCNVLVGYGARGTGIRAKLLMVLPLVVSISFLLIADIDSPRGGLIHVAPQNLVALSQSLPT